MEKKSNCLSPSDGKQLINVKWVNGLTVVIFEQKAAFLNIIYFLKGHIYAKAT